MKVNPGSAFRAATVPATFSGSAADNSGGAGLNANSTTFTLQRGSDGNYWTGAAWQVAIFNLATTHSATTSNTAATWTNSATLPTWASEKTHTWKGLGLFVAEWAESSVTGALPDTVALTPRAAIAVRNSRRECSGAAGLLLFR